MIHKKQIYNIGRKVGHRKNILSNMACSLIRNKRINTTLSKAKDLRRFIEPLITRSKQDSTHSRRGVFSYLKNKFSTYQLFMKISPKIINRSGGYTRILKEGYRLGDAAKTAIIELVI